MPRIDFLPVFSTPRSSCEPECVDLGEDGSAGLSDVPAAVVAWLDDLRLKKGMPDGVRRGLSRLDLERPGDVASRDGAEVAESAVFGGLAVLLLLIDAVLARVNADVAGAAWA